MPELVWNDAEMSVGHPRIDEEHRSLVDLLNVMTRAIESDGGSRDVIRKSLEELCNYTVKHFETEESLMDPSSYEEYDLHVTEHMDCTQTVLDFLYAFSEKNEGDLHEFSVFVQRWLINHVLGTDKTLGRFLQGRA